MNSVHRPAVSICCAYALGISVATFMSVHAWIWGFLTLAAVFLRHGFLALACAGAMMMGLHQIYPPAPVGIVEGVVVTSPQLQPWAKGQKSTFLLKHSQGIAQVDYYGDQMLRYGDRVKLSGKSFRRAQRFQKFQDIHGVFWQLSVKAQDPLEVIAHHQGNVFTAIGLIVHDRCVGTLRQYLDDDVAPTIIAMLFGDRQNMPKDIKTMFVRSGTAHILAISGMNMGIVAAMFFFIFKLMAVPRLWRLALTILFLWLYAIASGLSASVVRACLMVSVFLGGFIVEQEGDPLNSLGLSGFLLLLMDPGNLLDIGFQLSFAAVAGILLAMRPISEKLSFLPGWLNQSLAVSMAASVATMPILFFHFHTFTPIAIIANIPIVPLADIVVLLGLSLAFVGMFCPWAAGALAACLKAIFYILVWIAYMFSQIPGGHIIF